MNCWATPVRNEPRRSSKGCCRQVLVFNARQFDVDPTGTAVLIALVILALGLVALVHRLGSGRQDSLLSVESATGIATPGGESA